MGIESVRVKNFKNLKNSTINFRSNISGIYGPNGTGKTAIVEAINIISLYFKSKKSKKSLHSLNSKIKQLMSIGQNTTEIEIVLEKNKFLYKLIVEFKKDNEGNIYTSKEELSFKKVNSRAVYKHIAIIENGLEEIIPKFYLGSKKEEFSNEIEKKILAKKELYLKNLLLEFNNFNSYISLVFKYSKDIDLPNLSEELSLFLLHWENLNQLLETIVVVTLKEQALYNLDILLPLQVHNEKIHGNLFVNYGENNNVYDEKIAFQLQQIIEQIGDIFSVIIPDSKLYLEKEIVKVENELKKVALNIYIKRDGKKISIEKESTGIVKLVSLLSALIFYVQDENAIVVVDELDIHIFEYLLATLLEKLSKHAKGQLIFTAHNLLALEKLNKNSIIISSKSDKDIIYTYFKNTSKTTNLRQKYLRSQNLWSEDNIEPLLLNESALEMYLKKLVK